jgi:hypothetical protein
MNEGFDYQRAVADLATSVNFEVENGNSPLIILRKGRAHEVGAKADLLEQLFEHLSVKKTCLDETIVDEVLDELLHQKGLQLNPEIQKAINSVREAIARHVDVFNNPEKIAQFDSEKGILAIQNNRCAERLLIRILESNVSAGLQLAAVQNSGATQAVCELALNSSDANVTWAAAAKMEKAS